MRKKLGIQNDPSLISRLELDCYTIIANEQGLVDQREMDQKISDQGKKNASGSGNKNKLPRRGR